MDTMTKKFMSAGCAVAVAAVAFEPSGEAASVPPVAISAAVASWSQREAAEVLDALDTALGTYVDPEKGEAARAFTRANRSRYLTLEDRVAFAEQLTTEVGAALGDKHFYIRATGPGAGVAAMVDPAARAAAEAAEAYGIASVRRLPANIGYLDLRSFGSTPESALRINAAMDLLQDTDALIIDLRANRGGGAAVMDALIGRLASRPIPRSVRLWRRDDGGFDRQQPESAPCPIDRLYGRPVYVLTANFTISAAEAFAYDLQSAGRVKVVGETTRGGANPMNRPLHDLGHGLFAYVANGRSENPITGASPNGVGVRPDIPTRPEDALAVAYASALEDLPAAAPDTRLGGEVEMARADPEAQLRSSFDLTPHQVQGGARRVNEPRAAP
ncbi:MAG: S41 family peptidase [Alphaproteobacteria bacterium]|nr:S41 family peptidase [Alphaproteobacteria bacterium]